MPYVTSVERMAIDRGREQGIHQGRVEGRVEGQAKLLTQILTRRFGPLPPEVATRLSGASDADLGDWGERVIEATSLEDVFNRS